MSAASGSVPGAGEKSARADLDGKILRSSGWVAVSLGGTQLASVLSLLVLARLLEPKAFGLVSLAWAVLAFAEQIQESGIGAALIYRREDVESAAASALIWAPLASSVMYGAVFGLAPILAGLLHSPSLTTVVRVLALILPLRGLGVVPTALLERSLDFRSRSKADIGAAFVQLVVSLVLAALGAGVWSLVIGALAGGGAQVAILWIVVPWRPSLRAVSTARLREMMRYGRFVGVGNVLNVIENTVDNLAVARFAGVSALGFYSIAFRLADFPNSVLGHIVGRVTFPAYAMIRGDQAGLRRVYVQNLQRISFVSLPVSVGVMVAAKPLVLGVLGDKWSPAVTPLRILAAYGLMKSFASPAGAVFKGVGKPHYGPFVSISHLVVAVPLLYVLTRPYGITGAAIAVLILMALVTIPALGMAMRLLGLRAAELVKALAMQFFCAALLAASLLAVVHFTATLAPGLSLAAATFVGVAVFAGTSAVFSRGVLVPMWLSLRESRGSG